MTTNGSAVGERRIVVASLASIVLVGVIGYFAFIAFVRQILVPESFTAFSLPR